LRPAWRRIVYSVPVRLRLPIAIVAALVVAEAAVVLMRPRDRLESLDVAPRAYFSGAQIEKAHAFRSGQRWIYAGQLAIELGLLVLVVRRPPRGLRREHRRPVLAGAAAVAGLSAALTLAALPLGVLAQSRARDVGLVTQGWGGYASDVAKSTAISALLAFGGGVLGMAGMRRFGRGWWAPASVVVVLFGVAATYATPVVLDPLFNRFTPLAAGPTRSTVLSLARRAGVDVGQVYEMDASKRTTAANAYVTGIGRTKRVVLYDTLLKDFTPAEVELVVAHELGHVRHHDVPHGLLYLAIVTPFGLFAAARLGERLGGPPGTVGAIPALVLALALLGTGLTTVSNQLSRAVEARADAFSLELTHDPAPFIGFQKRVAVQNVAEPSPPAAVQFLLGTHPTTMQRIGMAAGFAAR
jgi:STE24 endopeptidase